MWENDTVMLRGHIEITFNQRICWPRKGEVDTHVPLLQHDLHQSHRLLQAREMSSSFHCCELRKGYPFVLPTGIEAENG